MPARPSLHLEQIQCSAVVCRPGGGRMLPQGRDDASTRYLFLQCLKTIQRYLCACGLRVQRHHLHTYCSLENLDILSSFIQPTLPSASFMEKSMLTQMLVM
ncbi:hypothetical protein HOLleu_40557 [Holothuria leucospilota]|uniref:Uncharacterized protein n=1 Tax=Holothuria leucospilota TaxID=206669 RepID=A0A9Q1BD88_HOLLE|nr:hypothetical protein HOLleu_40557 [Holothuria leucospilota]